MALVNIGTSPNDGTGDKLRNAFDKINTGKEDAFTKNTAFNKNFGTVAGTVAEGNHLHDNRYYTEIEVDNKLINKENLINHILTTEDLNTIIKSGMYRLGSNINSPVTYGQLLVIHGASDTITQIIGDFRNSDLYTRSGDPPEVGGAGSWKEWGKLWTNLNDGSGSGLDADLLDGYQSSVVSAANTVAVRDVNQDISARNFITTSDRRLKENIKALDKGVEGLKPVSFNFKEGDKSVIYGFIAQDMLETHPELVKGTGAEREDGSIDYYAIKQQSIIALLVKYAQDKDKVINDLENRIEKLESLINKLI